MNKKNKIAASAAAVAVVAGTLGGSTFALWNTSADSDDLAVNSGVLDVAKSGSAFQDVSVAGGDAPTSYDATAKAIDPATFKVSPGDTLAAVSDFTVSGTGQNLKYKTSVTSGTMSEGAKGKITLDVPYVNETASFGGEGQPDRMLTTRDLSFNRPATDPKSVSSTVAGQSLDAMLSMEPGLFMMKSVATTDYGVNSPGMGSTTAGGPFRLDGSIITIAYSMLSGGIPTGELKINSLDLKTPGVSISTTADGASIHVEKEHKVTVKAYANGVEIGSTTKTSEDTTSLGGYGWGGIDLNLAYDKSKLVAGEKVTFVVTDAAGNKSEWTTATAPYDLVEIDDPASPQLRNAVKFGYTLLDEDGSEIWSTGYMNGGGANTRNTFSGVNELTSKADGSARNLKLVTFAHFDKAVSNTDLQELSTVLSESTLNIEQVR